ncbi:MAG: RNA methyltransferase [Bacteroidaceae bacterium]|nr:RNA methyltransferase [Bacteroidaceae bacterium]
MRKLTIEEMGRMDVQSFKAAEKLPLIVVLDNVRSLHNVGSVFRTADAFRLEAIYLCGITACPPSAEIHKTALGAEDSVEWHYAADTCDVVRSLKEQGVVVFAVEQVEGSVLLPDLELDPSQRYAVVMGNEVKGVQQAVVDLADYALEIPQYGTKHSLNVSVTAGIVMWEFLKRLPIA